MPYENTSFGRRMYKEIFYLDNYVNLINGIDISGKKKTFHKKENKGPNSEMVHAQDY